MFEQPGFALHCPLDHAIDLIDETTSPTHHKYYSLSANELAVVQKYLAEMLQ